MKTKCKMDANENPYSLPVKIRYKIQQGLADFEFNRYPDSDANLLKKKLADYTGIKPEKLLIGNGSDELLLMIMTAIISPEGKAVISQPTFSMYNFYADIVGEGAYEVTIKNNFSINWARVREYSKKKDVDLIVFCSPNNPTGQLIDDKKLANFISKTNKYVLLDEAYYEFSGKTLIDLVNKYDNLIVTRTFSKAFAIASLRIGYLAADEKIISKLDGIRSPYNADKFSQETSCLILDEVNSFKKQWKNIRQNREKLKNKLENISGVNVYDSNANFILFNTEIPEKEVFLKLSAEGINIRFLEELDLLGDSLRVTVGTKTENNSFLRCLSRILNYKSGVKE